jgi:hypothetical protein
VELARAEPLAGTPLAHEVARRLGHDLGVLGDRIEQEDVAADHGAPADHHVAAQDRGAGVDRDVVLDGGVALDAAQGLTVSRRLGAQRHTLVEPHVVADLGGLADHDAGAVVDEEAAPDPRARVDVDAGPVVGMLRHHAWQDPHPEPLQLVRDAVGGDGPDRRIGDHDLGEALGGGVPLEGRLHVLCQQRADRRQLGDEVDGHGLGGRRAAQAHPAQQPHQPLDQRGDLRTQDGAVALGEHEALAALHPADHLFAVRKPFPGRLRERVVAAAREGGDGLLEEVLGIVGRHGFSWGRGGASRHSSATDRARPPGHAELW